MHNRTLNNTMVLEHYSTTITMGITVEVPGSDSYMT